MKRGDLAVFLVQTARRFRRRRHNLCAPLHPQFEATPVPLALQYALSLGGPSRAFPHLERNWSAFNIQPSFLMHRERMMIYG